VQLLKESLIIKNSDIGLAVVDSDFFFFKKKKKKKKINCDVCKLILLFRYCELKILILNRVS